MVSLGAFCAFNSDLNSKEMTANEEGEMGSDRRQMGRPEPRILRFMADILSPRQPGHQTADRKHQQLAGEDTGTDISLRSC